MSAETQSASAPLEAILFDFDGTLVDTSRAILESFNRALERGGHPPSPEATIRAMIGNPLARMFAAVLPGAGAPELARLVDAYRESFSPQALETIRLQPDVEAVLGRLESSLQLAVVTSRTSGGVRQILGRFEQLPAFQAIVGIEEVRHPKPDPEPVNLALEQLGVPAARALFVGDTPEDMRAAGAAGVRAVGLTTGGRQEAVLREAGAFRIFSRLGPLVALVEELTNPVGKARELP